jgi:hypothetical protein
MGVFDNRHWLDETQSLPEMATVRGFFDLALFVYFIFQQLLSLIQSPLYQLKKRYIFY